MNESVGDQRMVRSNLIAAVDLSHAELLAAIHRRCFKQAWDLAAMTTLLAQPGSFGRFITSDEAAGFILCRQIADEMEILTLCVVPEARRQRLGTGLLRSALDNARARRIRRVFLEVAVTNTPALRLYDRAGFAPVGRRAKYYRAPDGSWLDALVLAWSPAGAVLGSGSGEAGTRNP